MIIFKSLRSSDLSPCSIHSVHTRRWQALPALLSQHVLTYWVSISKVRLQCTIQMGRHANRPTQCHSVQCPGGEVSFLRQVSRSLLTSLEPEFLPI